MISDLPPSDQLGQKLCSIFNYSWLAIGGSTNDATDPNWETIGSTKEGKGKFPLRERTLWNMWQDPALLVGVRFDHTTTYGLIDVDSSSKYLSREGLQAIRDALETIGIDRVIVVRSSYSRGVHIYFPLPEAVPTFALATAIKYALEAQEIFLEPGQIEAFPNCKSYGRPWLGEFIQYNAHRLPLQPNSGSEMLDHDYRPVGASLAQFFHRWDFAAQQQDMMLLNHALKHGRDKHRNRPKLSAPGSDWKADLEQIIEEGWTSSGQTNQLLKDIACYGRVFQNLAGQELADFVERIAITRSGYLEFCGHQRDIARRASAWARSAESYYFPMHSTPPRHRRKDAGKNGNQERSEGAIARIQQAMLDLLTADEIPAGITALARKLCQVAGCGLKTLYRYVHLWHPQQRCEIDHTARDTADSEDVSTPPVNQLKPAPNKVISHLGGNMKGTPPENHFLKTFKPDSQERDRGPGKEKGYPQVQRYQE